MQRALEGLCEVYTLELGECIHQKKNINIYFFFCENHTLKSKNINETTIIRNSTTKAIVFSQRVAYNIQMKGTHKLYKGDNFSLIIEFIQK